MKPLPATSILAGPPPAQKKKPKRKFTREQLRSGQTFLTQQAWTNRFDSQSGTRGFGAVRHVADIKADDINREGQADIILQSGTNKFDSQAGTRGFGAVRHGGDIKVTELYDEEFDDEADNA